MAERFKAAVLKTVDGVTRPGVRIPLPPPLRLSFERYCRRVRATEPPTDPELICALRLGSSNSMPQSAQIRQLRSKR